ncbi:MAG: DUF3576 domain-containing protein [Alphaproteobacteria bacterium]
MNAMRPMRAGARVATAVCALLAASLLAGCGKSSVQVGGDGRAETNYTIKSSVAPEGQRRAFTRSGAGQARQISVNGFLWRAALDSTAFMPLRSADAYGGAIITDWYSPPESPGERFKITVLVQGATLRADGVKVSVFKQKRGPKGGWIDTKVAKNTGIDLENVILARARSLREQAAAR